MSKPIYTLADIERLTGAKRRAAQVWADARILQPVPESDRAGSGTHRRFTQKELEIAAVLAPLAGMGIPIGSLARVATVIRKLPLWSKRENENAKNMLEIMERARQGEGRNFLVCSGVKTARPLIDFVSEEDGSIRIRTAPRTEGAILVDLNEALHKLNR